jgi:3-hydroxymyristoyl/3-hydroxydecanoyl-(acyl carrier protein) dehydratase
MSYQALIRSGRRAPLYQPGPGAHRLQWGRSELERIVPHRPPMLLIDSLELADLDEKAIVARRQIDPADPVLAGHFPGDPVYPGVLLIETMAQACICLQHFLAAGNLELPATANPLRLRLLRVHHAVFVAEARPADVLQVPGKLIEETSYGAILAAQIVKGDTICAFAILEAYLLEG